MGIAAATAYGNFSKQGSNPRPLHWQVDSYPLRHQGGLDGSNFLLSLDELRSSSLSQEREETGKLDLKCNTAVEMALSS